MIIEHSLSKRVWAGLGTDVRYAVAAAILRAAAAALALARGKLAEASAVHRDAAFHCAHVLDTSPYL